MKTLRAKLALLLVVSIVSVVALITLAVMYVFATPKDVQLNLLAKQLIVMDRLAQQGQDLTVLSKAAHSGPIDQHQTDLLRSSTLQLGAPVDVIVTQADDSDRDRVASVRVAPDRWLLIDIDPPSDPELWIWFALITVGVGSIAVFAANRMSSPLALLENAVASVGPDGALPMLPEKGPAEVRATAIAINSLSARLKRSLESRMRLVAAAGHDFRTPLTRMRLRAHFTSDAEERRLWVRDIEELERIAESAIQLVREETTSQTAAASEIVRIDQLVRDVVRELQEQNFRISATETTEALVKANRLGLRRALRNLLINAATHGVRGTVEVQSGDVVRITILDEGPGIATELLEEVFEPFVRADPARSQSIPGAGLGLTISREIVQRDHGSIELFNSAGGGLRQVIQLPAVVP